MSKELTLKSQDEFVSWFAQMRPSLLKVLPKAVDPLEWCKLAEVATTRNPDLLDCTVSSLARGLLAVAELGLEIGSAMQEAYLLAFKNSKTGMKDAVLIIDYKSYLKFAVNHPAVSHIEAKLVYDADEFYFEEGSNPHIKHIPALDEDRGRITHCYSIAFLSNGRFVFEVMGARQLEAHAKRFRLKKTPLADEDKPWYFRKTMIRQISKYVPRSKELAKAIRFDQEYETTATVLPDIPEIGSEPETKTEAFKKQLKKKEEPIFPGDKPEPDGGSAKKSEPVPDEAPPSAPLKPSECAKAIKSWADYELDQEELEAYAGPVQKWTSLTVERMEQAKTQIAAGTNLDDALCAAFGLQAKLF